MKTLHLYLIRQVLTTLLMTVGVFIFVLLLWSVLREVLPLLVNRQASLLTAAKAIGLMIPFVMVFALPMGMLTATLLVFGRFSSDQELTAARASGVSLVSLVTPVLLVSVALSAVTAMINMQWAPQCRVASKELLYSIRHARPATFIPERTFTVIDTNIVYVRKIRATNLEDVLLYRLNASNQVEYIRAESGTLTHDPGSNWIHVRLFNWTSISYDHGKINPGGAEEIEFDYELKPHKSGYKPDIDEMTFSQLWDEWHELERRMAIGNAPGKLSHRELQEKMNQIRKAKRADLASPVRVQIHRQIAFSFSCLAFTLVGIPLGIRAHRRETTFGIFVALVLVGIYYSFFALGIGLETHHEWAPHLILWAPNFLFQLVGAVLLRRANHGV